MTYLNSGERATETNQSLVVGELNRLLRDDRFSGAPQMSAFLRYVVTETLKGKGGRIKAYTIGVDALGKPDTFDAQHDPSVRVLALRLRKALKNIYETQPSSEAIIEIKLGSYAPKFYQAKVRPSDFVVYGKDRVSDSSRTPAMDVISHRATPRDVHEPQYSRSIMSADSKKSRRTKNLTQHPTGILEWNRADLTRYAYMFLIIAAILYSMSVKFQNSADPLVAAQNTFDSELPVNLLAMRQTDVLPGENIRLHQNLPSVFIGASHRVSEQLDKVFMLISASLIDKGSLHVARAHDLKILSVPLNNDYMILFSEAAVDFNSRINAQILRIDTGAVIMSETLEFDTRQGGFSAADLGVIETLAHAISDPGGPLGLDFCDSAGNKKSGRCHLAHDVVNLSTKYELSAS